MDWKSIFMERNRLEKYIHGEKWIRKVYSQREIDTKSIFTERNRYEKYIHREK